jgi:hypothetical protein
VDSVAAGYPAMLTVQCEQVVPVLAGRKVDQLIGHRIARNVDADGYDTYSASYSALRPLTADETPLL